MATSGLSWSSDVGPGTLAGTRRRVVNGLAGPTMRPKKKAATA